MSTPAELMAGGMPALLANRIGADVATGITAAGSSQATATVLSAGFNLIGTAAASTGVLLPSNTDSVSLFNGGASPVSVYPPVGSFMNGVVNAAFTVTNGKTASFHRSGNQYIGNLSA